MLVAVSAQWRSAVLRALPIDGESVGLALIARRAFVRERFAEVTWVSYLGAELTLAVTVVVAVAVGAHRCGAVGWALAQRHLPPAILAWDADVMRVEVLFAAELCQRVAWVGGVAWCTEWWDTALGAASAARARAPDGIDIVPAVVAREALVLVSGDGGAEFVLVAVGMFVAPACMCIQICICTVTFRGKNNLYKITNITVSQIVRELLIVHIQ